MIKIDFHVHSIASPDGSITREQIAKVFEQNILDCIAITDHNHIDFALEMQKVFGTEKIIVGEEISTTDGEIVGLFLKNVIPAGLALGEAISQIRAQNGIVYVPHPFETVRSGITQKSLASIKDQVDIIEGANGRAYFQNFGPRAVTWAKLNNVPTLASSDAHHAKALGKTYSIISELPTEITLTELAHTARKHYRQPSLPDILAPKLNRLKKVFKLL